MSSVIEAVKKKKINHANRPAKFDETAAIERDVTQQQVRVRVSALPSGPLVFHCKSAGCLCQRLFVSVGCLLIVNHQGYLKAFKKF